MQPNLDSSKSTPDEGGGRRPSAPVRDLLKELRALVREDSLESINQAREILVQFRERLEKGDYVPGLCPEIDLQIRKLLLGAVTAIDQPELQAAAVQIIRKGSSTFYLEKLAESFNDP